MGFLLIFDLTNEKSFLDVVDWIDQLKDNSYTDTPDIVICGNKNDLASIRIISDERARNLAAKYQLPYIETSAATGQNVQRALDILLERIMMR